MPKYTQWSEKEDQILLDLIAQQDKRDWQYISKVIGTKNPRQCYDHYSNQLANKTNLCKIKYHQWTIEEENLIRSKGENISWRFFQEQHFPHLSIGQMKNKFHKLTSEHNSMTSKEPSDSLSDGKNSPLLGQTNDQQLISYLLQIIGPQ